MYVSQIQVLCERKGFFKPLLVYELLEVPKKKKSLASEPYD